MCCAIPVNFRVIFVVYSTFSPSSERYLLRFHLAIIFVTECSISGVCTSLPLPPERPVSGRGSPMPDGGALCVGVSLSLGFLFSTGLLLRRPSCLFTLLGGSSLSGPAGHLVCLPRGRSPVLFDRRPPAVLLPIDPSSWVVVFCRFYLHPRPPDFPSDPVVFLSKSIDSNPVPVVTKGFPGFSSASLPHWRSSTTSLLLCSAYGPSFPRFLQSCPARLSVPLVPVHDSQ